MLFRSDKESQEAGISEMGVRLNSADDEIAYNTVKEMAELCKQSKDKVEARIKIFGRFQNLAYIDLMDFKPYQDLPDA